jgi:hypothetical protein
MVVMTPGVATGAFAHPVLIPRLALGARANLTSWLRTSLSSSDTAQPPRHDIGAAVGLSLGADRIWPSRAGADQCA